MSHYNRTSNTVFMTCNDWENTRRTMVTQHYQHVQNEWRRRAAYFRRQRSLGCIIFVVGAILILIGHLAQMNFLGYLGLTAGALGLYVIVAKHMLLVDEYYLECQSKMNMI